MATGAIFRRLLYYVKLHIIYRVGDACVNGSSDMNDGGNHIEICG